MKIHVGEGRVVHGVLLGIAVFGGLFGCDRVKGAAVNREGGPESVLAVHGDVSLGLLETGQDGGEAVWVVNTSNSKVEISAIEPSCECVEVRLAKMSWAPGERVMANVKYNGAGDASFVGAMRVEVGLFNGTSRVGRVMVSVEVLSEEEYARHSGAEKM